MPRSHPAATRHNQPQPRPPGHTRSPACPATALRATPGRLPAQPPPAGPHPAAQRGFCTIRRIATACRRRVAPLMLQFPTHHPSHDPDRHQRRSAGPHPVACPLSHRSPGHTPPPNGGFCTIRRIATACRRRVAPLMLQFPTHHPSHDPDRHQRRSAGPHPVACPLSHRSPGHTPPPNGGFCTIRRIATACRRRVAPLMAQFPPHTTPATAPTATSDGQPGHAPPRTPATTRLATAHPAASPAAPGHARSPARPATARRATPRHPTGGFAPLDAPLRRVAGVSHP